MGQSSLLDFITTLVHDPDAAAAYRADPQSALSAANLHDVTTADVDHLIPVVAESATTAASGSVWSASSTASSFDSLDSAFDVPTSNPDAAFGVDYGGTQSHSSFDASSIPSVDTDHTTAQAFDEPTSIDVPDTTTVSAEHVDFTELPAVAVDTDWHDSSTATAHDGFGVDGHDHAIDTDHSGFDGI